MDKQQGTLKTYISGFLLCIFLTLAAYVLVMKHLLTGLTLTLSIVSLGIIQFFVQLILFLHLGDEPKPRWNLIVFSFMALVVLILVFGSIWIMINLQYRMM